MTGSSSWRMATVIAQIQATPASAFGVHLATFMLSRRIWCQTLRVP